MSDSPLRQRKIMVKCPKCKGHKGIYGRSATGHPATLPCPQCDACGEVDWNTLPPNPSCNLTLTDLDLKQEEIDKTFNESTKKWGW